MCLRIRISCNLLTRVQDLELSNRILFNLRPYFNSALMSLIVCVKDFYYSRSFTYLQLDLLKEFSVTSCEISFARGISYNRAYAYVNRI